jgi:hypothetical protein
MLTIRPLKSEDYKTLCEFWQQWGWTPPPQDFLPEIGMIVYDEETPIAASYLYITNSKVCWLEWVISNKNYKNRENRKNAINLLIETLINMAKNGGYKYIYTERSVAIADRCGRRH